MSTIVNDFCIHIHYRRFAICKCCLLFAAAVGIATVIIRNKCLNKCVYARKSQSVKIWIHIAGSMNFAKNLINHHSQFLDSFFSLVNRFLFQVKLAIPLNIPLCIWLFYVVHHAITRRSLAVPFFLCCNCFIVSSNSLIIVFMIAHKSLQLIENKHITSAE